jgi:hypothetical protein
LPRAIKLYLGTDLYAGSLSRRGSLPQRAGGNQQWNREEAKFFHFHFC